MYCNVSEIDSQQAVSVETISSISCGLSILGAVVIFQSYMLVPEIRKYATRKLLMFLTMADLLTPLGMCIFYMY